MNVHYVAPFFHPVVGGVETRLRELGQRLAERGHRVTVHCTDRTPDGRRLPRRDRFDGIEVERTSPLLRKGGYRLFFAPQILSGGVVDVQGYPFLPGDWLRLARRQRLLLVHTPHGASFAPPNPLARAAARAYDAVLGLPTLRRARRVVVMTEAETLWLTARGVPASRIVEVPSGVPDEGFELFDGGFASERWGLERYVLFLGRLFSEKRPLDLVEAFALLGKDEHTGAIFAGPEQGEGVAILNRAAQLGLAGRVIVAGHVSETEKWRLLAGCEALAVPSAWEALGIAILEAWAQAKPVVATRVGGVPAVVDHGRTGLLVPVGRPAELADALRILLADPARARAMGEAGRALAKAEYRWDDLAERAERVYAEVAAAA